jgi:hypothetical protein
MAACACSSPDTRDVPTKPSGWLTLTLSQPSGGQQCLAAAPTPYEFGSETKPLVEQVSCSVHWTEDDAWFWGRLADSRTSRGGENLVFSINTEHELAMSLVTDLTGGTLQLEPADTASCAPLASLLIDNAASIDFDCPLLVDASDPASGCGVRGTVTFENCENVE